MLTTPENPPSMAGSSKMGIQCPPVASLPVDYEVQGDGEPGKATDVFVIDIANPSVLSALTARFLGPPSVSFSEVVASIFCATVSRITGHTDGTLLFGRGISHIPSPICYDIDTSDCLTDITNRQFKSTHRYHSFPDTQHHKILFIVDTDEHTDESAPSSPLFHPALTRWELFLDGNGVLRASITFSPHVFQHSTIHTYADVFKRLVEACALGPLEKLSTMPLSNSADISTIHTWNNTQKDPLDASVSSIGSLFRRVAKNFPTHVAVTNGRGGLMLTYEELDRTSDALALWLVDQGYGNAEETIIGIWQTRGVMLVVSCLACLKAGCAYMLIEKNLPANRIKVMLEITACPLVIVDGYSQKFPLETAIRCINLSQPQMQTLLFDSQNTPSTLPPSDLPEVVATRLAYVVFTSGSTGIPKAVMVQHDNLLNCVLLNIPNLGPTDRMPMIASIAFDASIGETWIPLAHGATLVVHIPASGNAFDVADMADFLQSEKITGFVGPTSMVRSLLRDTDFFDRNLPALRWLAVGGEAATFEVFGDMLEANNKISFINLYGPSECTIYATQFNIPPGFRRSNIPIGRTTPNTRGYVIDDAFNLVPPGVCGELFLVGDSIARGYLGQHELTDSRFAILPSTHPLGAVRGYRTGDLVRALSSGDLEFVRRKEDGQIKLRSHRVELGEIEHVIKRHGGVIMALVVLSKRGNGNDHLVAYFTSQGTDESSQQQVNEIRDLCKAHLSVYMIPSFIFRIATFPLSVTGKVDRKLLASAEYVDQVIADSRLDHHVTASPPLSPQERSVLQVFADTLGSKLELLSMDDNFYDLGGHSMIAVQVVTAIKRVFSVALPMHVFMDNATAAGVSEFITNHQPQPTDDLAFAYIDRTTTNIDHFPASNAQMGIWVQEQINPGLSTYNTGFQRRLEGTLSVSALQAAFDTIIERHDVLRTTFNMQDRMLMQHVHPKEAARTAVCVYKANDETGARAILLEQAVQLFDLTTDIPIRVTIVVVDAQTHYLSIIIHHIATDGWSLEIIDSELTSLYNTLLRDGGHSPSPLDALPLRYGDFAGWQNRMSKSEIVQDQLRYWSEQLKGTRALELFTDYPRPTQASGRADEIGFDLDAGTVESLRQLAFYHRTSLYVILLAAFRAFVYRLNGEEQGTLGMVNANRSLPEIAGVVGFFVNTHAIHLSVDSDSTFEDLIHTTRGVVAAALEHSDVPFDQVVAEVMPERHLARHVLIQLELVLQDFTHLSEKKFGQGLTGIKDEDIRMPSTNLDLAVHFFVRENGLRGYMMYQTDLFSSATVQSHVRVFKQIVKSLVDDPTSKISLVNLFTSIDAKNLSEWNSTSTQTLSPASLVEGFRNSVASFGPDVAVVDGAQSLAYHDLDKMSDHLASFLITKGFVEGDSIGIFMGRSCLLVIAYIACLKAGLVYLPLDRSLPVSRLHAMVQIARCRLVLATGSCPLSANVECMDISGPHMAFSAPRVPFPLVDADTVCCYMFTSGSTGVPKGVVVEHRGMANLCAPELTHWPGRRRNAVTNGIGFDPSGFQIFSSLLTGSPLYCLPDEGIFDAQEFIQFLLYFGIQRCDTTPSVMASLLMIDEGRWLESSSLEHVLLGGEKVEISQVMDLHRRRPSLKLSAVYGPTEASVTSTIYDLSTAFFEKPLRQIPLGRAIPNTSAYVLDRALQPVPAGVLGEIAVSGPNICRGYLDLPETTAKAFVKNSVGDGRMYLTGDLGYWQADGVLNFAGRVDSQVKIRGQRIEASEVEHALNSHPYVKSSAVVVVKNEEDDILVGYVQLHEGSASENELLALWSDHYNDEALCEELVDGGGDSAQWASMLDGKPIDQAEMDRWLDDTVMQIAARPEDRLLEIGVGTGQVALRVADNVTSFIGTDISRPSLDYLQRQIDERALSSKVSLHLGPAHDLSTLGYANLTLVVVNSVVQYFPSAEYLASVVSELVGVMPGDGRIFIGDVRSHALITYHDTERALASLPAQASTDDVRKTLEHLAKTQTELLLAPAYFYSLQRRFRRIAHVEIRPKDMEARNELSRYRYAAVLHVGQKPAALAPPNWHDFGADVARVGLASLLRDSREDVVGVTKIPVVDLEGIRQVWSWIHAPDTAADVACLRAKLSALLDEGSVSYSPATLTRIAAAEGWAAVFDHSRQSFDDTAENYIQAIFTRTSALPSQVVVGDFRVPMSLGSGSAMYNTIAGGGKAGIPEDFKDVIAGHLRSSLPKYMIPRIVEIKEEWPLTRTGKLDVKLLQSVQFLQEHDKDTAKPARTFESPKTDTERKVLAVFSDVLKCPEGQIDVLESFFDLGGHSLRAAIAVGSLRREFDVTISMAAFFLRPCIRDIATAIDAARKLPQAEAEAEREEHATDDIAALAAATIVANPGAQARGTLFLFPESTGFASAYSSAFAQIPRRVVAFGEAHWGAPEPGPRVSSIRDLARAGVARMRAHQAAGPYCIAGWSVGGYVALEAAAQLEAAGEAVGLVVMFDSILSDVGEIDVREAWKEEYAPLLEVVDDRARWMVQMNRANARVKGFRWERGRLGAGCRVVLVRAGKGKRMEDGDGAGGWKETVPQIEVVEVESATHRTMFDGENGPKMGRLINGLLNDTFRTSIGGSVCVDN